MGIELTNQKGIPGLGRARGMGRFRHLAIGDEVVVPEESVDPTTVTEAEDPYSRAEVLGLSPIDEATAVIRSQMQAEAQPVTMPLIRTLVGGAAMISMFSNFANGIPFVIRAAAAVWGLYPVAVPLLRR